MSFQAQLEVLIVDDDPSFARALSLYLQHEGYGVHVVHSARDAIERARQCHLNAAILDIHLPDLHGLTLSRQLREACGEGVPILILSGDGSMDVISALPEAGVTYYFRKPVDVRQLAERLGELLRTADQSVTPAW